VSYTCSVVVAICKMKKDYIILLLVNYIIRGKQISKYIYIESFTWSLSNHL
jgi:hypothetical protein